MADHMRKEKGNPLPLWDKISVIAKEEYWKRKDLKEAARILGYVTTWVAQV